MFYLNTAVNSNTYIIICYVYRYLLLCAVLHFQFSIFIDLICNMLIYVQYVILYLLLTVYCIHC